MIHPTRETQNITMQFNDPITLYHPFIRHRMFRCRLRGIAHRDLKPENVLVVDRSWEDPNVIPQEGLMMDTVDGSEIRRSSPGMQKQVVVNGVDRVDYVSTGAAFLPSTVCLG